MSARDATWWNHEPDDKEKASEAHDAVFSAVEWMKQDQAARKERDRQHASLYLGREVTGFGLEDDGGAWLPRVRRTRNTHGINVTRSVIDTVAARISKTKPRPTVLTEGGKFEQKQRAKLLQLFVDGQFYATAHYPKMQQVFLDACIFGRGFYKMWAQGKRIVTERVLPTEIWVDDYDAIYGDPRCLYQVKTYHREVLRKLFPDSADDIDAAAPINTAKTRKAGLADMLVVIEAWHLPSEEDADDGRRVVAIREATLVEETWEHDRFPFATYQWKPSTWGYWGTSLVEELADIQRDINATSRTIQTAQRLCAPHLAVSKQANFEEQHATNSLWTIWHYDNVGGPPTPMVFPAIAPEYYEHQDAQIQRAFQLPGVSQLSASGMKPAGIEAAVAIRELLDTESERHVLAAQRWEETNLDAATYQIELASSIRGYEVIAPAKSAIRRIKWKEVDLERDQYQMQLFPASQLPRSPAARKDFLQSLYNAKAISTEQFLEGLDLPDVTAMVNRRLAPRRLVDETIERILVGGESVVAEPYDDHDYIITTGNEEYAQARAEEAPPEHLDLLRRYINSAVYEKRKKEQAAQPPAPPPQPGMTPPPAQDAIAHDAVLPPMPQGVPIQ